MPSTYTVNLGIEKPATGEQSGTWGDTVNDNSNILDEAVNGVVSINLSSAGSSGSPNQIAITNGASSTGRNKWIEFTDGSDLGASAYVELIPNDAEKICFIRNSLRSSRSILLFQGTYNASNDLEVVAGTDVVVKFSGSGTGATVVNIYANLAVDALVASGEIIATGGITTGASILSDTDSTDSLGSTGVRWLKGWFDTLTAGTLTIGSGSVTDSSGAISLGNDNLTTTGIVTAAGTSVFTNLDISGDVDIDGTLNVDAIDIDGALQLDGALTVGVDDTGYDVKFFGDTASAFMLWDTSGDDLILGGAAQLGIGNGTTAPTATLDVRRADVSGKIAEFHQSAGYGLEFGSSQAQAYIQAGSLQTLLITVPSDMTIDSGGDITLDVAGGDVRIKADGTQEMQFKITDGANVDIISTVADDDMRLRGNDGGATITALTLDMSAAGAATFNAGITATTATFSSTIAAGAATFTTADNSETLSLISTDADATSGPVLKMYRNSGSPADSDQTGQIKFTGRNDSSQDVDYARIITQIKDASDATEDGRLAINTMSAGDIYSRINIIETETVFNDESIDVDFRVESADNANMLFVDASANSVGIGTTSPARALSTKSSSVTIGSFESTSASGGMISFVDQNTTNDVTVRAGALGNDLVLQAGGATRMTIASAGAATFSSTVTIPTTAYVGTSIVHQDDTDTSIDFATNTMTHYSGGTRSLDLASGSAVFNEGGIDVDFRVESADNANMLFVDASANSVGIGTATPNITGFGSGTNGLEIADATHAGMRLNGNAADSMYFISGSGAHWLYGKGAVPMTFATNTVERLGLGATGNAVFNETGIDADFRVESDAITHALFVDGESGDVGIGATNTAARLCVTDAINTTQSNPQFQIVGSGFSGFHFLDANSYHIGQNSNSRDIRVYSGSDPTAGAVLAAGGTSWGTYSDERLKYDIEGVEDAVGTLDGLRCVKYRLKGVDEADSKKKIGLIAQDLVGVLDEVIDPVRHAGDDTEYMAVRYAEVVPVLVKAIQELTARITTLEGE